MMIEKHSISGFLLTVLLPAVLLLSGCARLGDSPVGPADDGTDRVLVPVTLSLRVVPITDGMVGSKADYEPDTDGYSTANAVKTLLLLQFEWQDADTPGAAKLVNQQFIPDGDRTKARLVASSVRNTICLIANAWGKISLPRGITMAEFLEHYNADRLSSLDNLTGTGIWYTPDGVDRYLRMSAVAVVDNVPLDDGAGEQETIGTFTLRCNCAKVVVRLKQDTDRVDISAVQLRSINRKYHYIPEIPAALSPLAFADPYSALDPCRFNDGERAYPDGGVEDAEGYRIYSWYVPVNEAGTIDDEGQKRKNMHAPAGATYLAVFAASGGVPVNYTYYLGADLLQDFNLKANRKYTYTIRINGKGNPDNDSRIEDLGDVTFTRDANSYMLITPMSRDGQSPTRLYKIPVRRAAVFWNAPQTSADESLATGVYGAAISQYSYNYTLKNTTKWEASFVWNAIYDAEGNPVAADRLLVDEDGNGQTTVSGQGFAGGENPYIRIKVGAGMQGNAVVAIKKVPNGVEGDTDNQSDDQILWSWHLWVTDYNPYWDMTPAANTYFYGVPGGEIHRYADKAPATLWTSGEYASAFIMDRDLGAVAAPTHLNNAKGNSYQFGRKDPIPATGAISEVSAQIAGNPWEGHIVRYNIRYSVYHPEVRLTNTAASSNLETFDWTAYETEAPVIGQQLATWIDPKLEAHAESGSDSDHCEADKSIYDPCPYGWKVPRDGTWAGMSTPNTTERISSPTAGWYYYPEGKGAGKGRVWYSGTHWTSTNGNVAQARCWFETETTIYPSYGGTRVNNFPVRCIRTSFRTPY